MFVSVGGIPVLSGKQREKLNQIDSAKTILLSRTQRTTNDKLNKVVQDIRNINEQAHIVTTPWEQLKAEQITSIAEDEVTCSIQAQLEQEEKQCHSHADGHDPHCGCGCKQQNKHQANEVFDFWGLETPKVFKEDNLTNILKSLNDPRYGTVIRGKGIVEIDQGQWIS